MDQVALDTTFLIDLQNERRDRGPSRGAIHFLRTFPDTELLLPSVALGEYLEGFDDPGSSEAQALVSPLQLLHVTANVALIYAATARKLRSAGRLIGTNDLWIACTARSENLPLLTRNVAEFRRVPGLSVVGYSGASP
jgi:tRNA(fMet)-specific endonuclease VapC